MEDVVQLLAALADPTRLRLLVLLGQGEVCVCHLQAILKTNQPKISRHLRVLKEAGLVSARREGKWVYYQKRNLSGNKQFIVQESITAVMQTKEAKLDLAKLKHLPL